MDPSSRRQGWRWWVRLGMVLAASVAAVLLILAGALRFLDQAQREHDRVECLIGQVRHQAQTGADMGSVVLNPANTLAMRQAAFVDWAAEQGHIADRIGRC